LENLEIQGTDNAHVWLVKRQNAFPSFAFMKGSATANILVKIITRRSVESKW